MLPFYCSVLYSEQVFVAWYCFTVKTSREPCLVESAIAKNISEIYFRKSEDISEISNPSENSWYTISVVVDKELGKFSVDENLTSRNRLYKVRYY